MASSGHESVERGLGPILVATLTRLPCDPGILRAPVIDAFGRDVVVDSMVLDLDAAYDARRNQYHSTNLLRQLRDERPAKAACIVGLADLDLYIPILTYVFGEAQLGGEVAVVSTFRLREPWLAGGVDPIRFERRLIQTVLHELGHTYGLRHCLDPTCVMASAASLEMLDEKGDDFCLDCKAQLRS